MQSLKAVERSGLGTHQTRKLRAAGKVPAIMYGHGEQPLPLAVDGHDLAMLLVHGERLVEVDMEGQKAPCLIKDLQHDPFGAAVIHMDLTRVNLDERVKVTVSLVLRGTPAGATDGGVLVPGLAEVEVECVVTSIPDEIRVRVNEMKVGDVLHVKDLPPMEGVQFLTDGEAIVASCRLVAEEVAAAAPAEGAESTQPEIIGKGKKEEEGEAAAAEA